MIELCDSHVYVNFTKQYIFKHCYLPPPPLLITTTTTTTITTTTTTTTTTITTTEWSESESG